MFYIVVEHFLLKYGNGMRMEKTTTATTKETEYNKIKRVGYFQKGERTNTPDTQKFMLSRFIGCTVQYIN